MNKLSKDEFVLQNTCKKLRRVSDSKYERTNIESFDKWCELFRILETKYALRTSLNVLRREDVKEVLSNNLLKKLSQLLVLLKTETDSSNEEFEQKRIQKNRLQYKKKHKCIGISNPYVEFFEKPPEEVAVWRKNRERKPFERMSLPERSDHLTNQVIGSFVHYASKFDNDDEKEFSFENIKTLFEIQFKKDIKPKELVQEKVSLSKIKSADCNKYLHKQNDYISRNYKYRKDHENLRSMSCVFEGITYLTSTKAYCNWLKNNPDKVPPPFLKALDFI